ncbi:MAG: ABC transporter substrate-binding protein [Rhodoferax sp.]
MAAASLAVQRHGAALFAGSRNRARLLLSLLAQTLLVSLAAAEPLRIALSITPLSLPFYVAQSQGYLAAEGLQVKITDVIGGHRTLQQVFDGNADLATSSEAVVMFNSFKRKDFAVIATFVTSDDDVRLVTRAGSGIVRPSQLAHKRVATVIGAASHYFLDTSLIFSGVDPKTVQTRNLQPEAMAEALEKGEVDAIAIWEPHPYQALTKITDAAVLPKSGGYLLSFNLIISKKLQGVRDDDLVKLLRALDRAQNFIEAEPVKAKAVLRDRLQADQKFMDYLWPRYKYRLSLNQSLLTTMEGQARWARQEGYVKSDQSPNYLDFIYAAPLRRVRAASVNIRD